MGDYKKYIIILIIILVIVYIYINCRQYEKFADTNIDISNVNIKDAIKNLSVIAVKLQNNLFQVGGDLILQNKLDISGFQGNTIFNNDDDNNYISNDTIIDGRCLMNGKVIFKNQDNTSMAFDASSNFNLKGNLNFNETVEIKNNLSCSNISFGNKYIDKNILQRLISDQMCAGYLSDKSGRVRPILPGENILDNSNWDYVYVFKGWKIGLWNTYDNNINPITQEPVGYKNGSERENRYTWIPLSWKVYKNTNDNIALNLKVNYTIATRINPLYLNINQIDDNNVNFTACSDNDYDKAYVYYIKGNYSTDISSLLHDGSKTEPITLEGIKLDSITLSEPIFEGQYLVEPERQQSIHQKAYIGNIPMSKFSKGNIYTFILGVKDTRILSNVYLAQI